jgi:hypothetical protein
MFSVICMIEITDIDVEADVSWFTIVVAYIEKMQEFHRGIKQLKGQTDELAAYNTCRNYRRASAPYLKFIKTHLHDLQRYGHISIVMSW